MKLTRAVVRVTLHGENQAASAEVEIELPDSKELNVRKLLDALQRAVANCGEILIENRKKQS